MKINTKGLTICKPKILLLEKSLLSRVHSKRFKDLDSKNFLEIWELMLAKVVYQRTLMYLSELEKQKVENMTMLSNMEPKSCNLMNSKTT